MIDIKKLENEINRIIKNNKLNPLEKKINIVNLLSGKYKGKNGELKVYQSPDNRSLLAVSGKFNNQRINTINLVPHKVLNALSKLDENSNNETTKPIGTPRGKAPYMPTDGINDRPKSWESKLTYWRKMIEKMIGYKVLE